MMSRDRGWRESSFLSAHNSWALNLGKPLQTEIPVVPGKALEVVEELARASLDICRPGSNILEVQLSNGRNYG
jgi:hypothetical protein